MKVHDVVQRGEEWRALRLGRLCSSRAADMLSTLKSGGEAAGRRNLRVQLVLERLTGRSHENGYQSEAMRNGTDREADALGLYEAVVGVLVDKVGYVTHDTLMAGGSPDGVIGDFEGLAEAKSPIPATHLEYLRTGKVPGEYLKQVQHLLWLTGAQWCDWFSYQPDFPEPLQVKVVRVVRDEKEMESYGLAVSLFLSEVDKELAFVRSLMPKVAA